MELTGLEPADLDTASVALFQLSYSPRKLVIGGEV